MPPRNVNVLAKARVLQGGGTKLVTPPRIHPEAKAEITECPLCVEPMDQTDLGFQPCPCGYLVCLFCYHKLKNLCNGLCPNCRREYGSAVPVEVSVVTDVGGGGGLRDGELTARQNQAINYSTGPAGVRGGGNDVQISGTAAAAAAAARAAQAATAAATTRAVQQAGTLPPVPRRAENGPTGPGRGGRAGDDAPALPSGATWAAQAGLQRQASEAPAPPPPPAPVIADTSAWPDLAAAALPPPVAPPPRMQRKESQPLPADATQATAQQQQAAQQQLHPPQTANGAAVATHAPPSPLHTHAQPPPAPQHINNMTQDPVVSPEQLGIAPGIGAGMPSLLGGYHTQVNTHVFGSPRTVSVMLPGAQTHQDLYPEAATLRAQLEQAVQAGTLTPAQATAEMMALLRQHEVAAVSGRPVGVVAASRPPPGFAPTPQQQQQQQQGYGGHVNGNTSLFNPTDSPVPPIGRMQPIGTPIGPPGPQQQQHQQQPAAGYIGQGNGRYANGASKPTPGTYTLWGAGVPDLSGYAMHGKAFNGVGMQGMSSLSHWLNGGAHMANGNGLDTLAGALGGLGNQGAFGSFHGLGGLGGGGQPGAPAKPPPPGFAPVPQQSLTQTGGIQDPEQMQPNWYSIGGVGSSFSFNNAPPGVPAAARGPPPGMSAYRPQQLGTGA